MDHQDAHRPPSAARRRQNLLEEIARFRQRELAGMPDRCSAPRLPDPASPLVAAITTELVSEIRQRHDLAPTATAAVGRLGYGAVLLGANLKGRERISLQIPATDRSARSPPRRGCSTRRRSARAPTRADRMPKCRSTRAGSSTWPACSEAACSRSRNRTKSVKPYVGVVPLTPVRSPRTSPMYSAHSEQIPSVVALGVLANPGGRRGGRRRDRASAARRPTSRRSADSKSARGRCRRSRPSIAQGVDANGAVARLAGDAEMRSERRFEVRFACRCTRKKVETALPGFGRDGLVRMKTQREETAGNLRVLRQRLHLHAGPKSRV